MKTFKVIVLSDSHGAFGDLYDVILKHKDNAHCFIHLGDGYKEVDELKAFFPDIKLYFVRGNCDFSAIDSPFTDTLFIGGKKIIFTHGHLYHVKYSLSELTSFAHQNHADIILYGHTHLKCQFYEDNLYVMNPGSLGHPREGRKSYGIIDISDAGILMNIVDI